jgi:NAD(P)H-dependent FMN reductase
MNITIIVGSHRTESNSSKVGGIVKEVLNLQNKELNITIIDLGKNPLPMWDEKVWQKTPQWKEILQPYQEILSKSDGLVIISPEYCGMASPALKNFMLFWTGEVLAHKPAMLIGVSSTEHGGSYPISELRSSSYKNSRILYIPDHVIIRSADELPSTIAEFSTPENKRILGRLEHGLGILMNYSQALKPMRESTDFDFENYANGM